MRVALVTESGEADAVRGIGVYTRELLAELKKLENEDFKTDLVNKIDPYLDGYNILHYPDFRVYFSNLNMNNGVKTVVTIHDVIPLIYPKEYPPGIKGLIRLQMQKLLLKKVDKIITVSETSRKDIVRLLNVDVGKIKVIYEAPRNIFSKNLTDVQRESVKNMYKLPDKFVLYVGDVNYNKNINNLAEACELAKFTLVIVGKQAANENVALDHPENRTFSEFLLKYGKNKNIIRLGFVPDEDLAVIYKLASVYCQPSFYEGFGLSVLEAMASGVPVVIARTQALVEVAGGAALIADPHSAKDLSSKLSLAVNNRKIREKLISEGLKNSSQFTWGMTAKKTLKLYQGLIE